MKSRVKLVFYPLEVRKLSKCSYREENTSQLQSLVFFAKEIIVYSGYRTKPHKKCGQNTRVMIVKAGGAYILRIPLGFKG